jgi:hypothetical protein
LSSDGDGGNEDVTEPLTLGARERGPDGRSDVGRIVVEGKDNGLSSESFEGKHLTLERSTSAPE